ncbi:MAG: AGE family epimerase/isomerase [Anaerolineae bacterium]|nr:AGE family epimerase/isomerase [Anaerolineae bacterium]
MNNIIDTAINYQSEVLDELVHNILPFYIEHAIDEKQGGFYGFITNNLAVKADAPKGLIQNSRLLWTYSHAYRLLKNDAYRPIADRAYSYLLDRFWDVENGGFYWMLTHKGKPLDDSKLTYGQAFCVYALTEYYLATQDASALEKSLEAYRLIEEHFLDTVHGGYIEGGSRDWVPSDKASLDDAVATKSMNTQLHVLEAYTNLVRVHQDAHKRLQAAIDVMVDHVIDPDTWHFKLHFDADWRAHNDHISYGHDIEGSWLLVEAAEVLNDAMLIEQAKNIAIKMAQATYDEGRDQDGSLFYEGSPRGLLNPNKDWWPQAEAMIGFLNAYQISGELHFYKASLQAWQFVRNYIIDKKHGEWFWGVTPDGKVIDQGKTGPWKSPYHNARTCLEVHRRLKTLMIDD